MNEQTGYPLPSGEFFKKAIFTLVFVLFLNLFFFRPFGPAAFALFSIGTFWFGLFAFYQYSFTQKFLIPNSGLFLALLFSSFLIVSRANGFISFLQSSVIVGILTLFLYILSARIPFVRSILELLFIPLNLIAAYFKSLLKVLPRHFPVFFNPSNATAKQKYITSTIIGFGIGIPIVVILIMLLSQADPIYSAFIDNLFKAEFLQRLFWRVVLSAIFFVFFLAASCMQRKKEFYSPIRFLSNYSLMHEMTIVMILVGIVLGSFLIIQWPYVFADVAYETHLSQFGVATYSEYVRRGFSELLFISFFLYAIIWLGLVFLRNKKEGQFSILKFVQLFVLGEFLIFISSIFRRILLYQQYHGWSLIRIYGGFFLIWVSGITVFLIARHFWHKKFVIAEVVFSAALILILGFFNAEEFIVQDYPPTVNNRVDYTYLARMSPDGYAGWQQAFNYADAVLLQKGLEQEEIIGKDDRGQVRYAGLVTKKLTQHYYTLLLEYGSDEEIKAYYKDLLRFQIQQLQETVKWLERERQHTIEVLISKGMDANRPIQEDYDIEFEKGRIRKTQDLLEKIDKKYKSGADVVAHISIYSNFSYEDLTSMTFYDIHDYDRNKTTSPKDVLSILYEWNYSKQQAYLKMKADIPYQKLFALQKKYFELQNKIHNQPEDQRDTNNDISFDAPFLEPL